MSFHFPFRTGLPVVLALFLPVVTLAELPPAKPYAQLVAEVIGFLFSDVGRTASAPTTTTPRDIRSRPYFYSYRHQRREQSGRQPGRVSRLPLGQLSRPTRPRVAIDAFLDWRRWSAVTTKAWPGPGITPTGSSNTAPPRATSTATCPTAPRPTASWAAAGTGPPS